MEMFQYTVMLDLEQWSLNVICLYIIRLHNSWLSWVMIRKWKWIMWQSNKS